MKLTHIATESGKTGCPTVFATDRDTFVVQGWKIDDQEAITAMRELGLPDHETAVEIPVALVKRIQEIELP